MYFPISCITKEVSAQLRIKYAHVKVYKLKVYRYAQFDGDEQAMGSARLSWTRTSEEKHREGPERQHSTQGHLGDPNQEGGREQQLLLLLHGVSSSGEGVREVPGRRVHQHEGRPRRRGRACPARPPRCRQEEGGPRRRRRACPARAPRRGQEEGGPGRHQIRRRGGQSWACASAGGGDEGERRGGAGACASAGVADEGEVRPTESFGCGWGSQSGGDASRELHCK